MNLKPRFIAQLQKRLPDVFTVHPQFRQRRQAIGGLTADGFEKIVARAGEIDAAMPAPFSVLIHGDLNVDNVIFDPSEGSVRFIDMHRSRQMDWVQDASVLIVSNMRLQVFEAPVRRRINSVVRRFFEFFRSYAAGAGDPTFEARLALGLARSLATSTRFVLDRDFAKSMFMRARYLLERLVAAEDPARFQLPKGVLVD